MKRFFTIAIAIIICLFPQVGFAHSKLVSATPAADTTVTEKVDEVRLTFNTTIEQGSTLTLTDEAGKEIPVTVQVKGKELIAAINETMPNGMIKVNWKIIGADGHLIDGDYQFTYQITQQPTEQEQPQPKPKTETTPPQPETNETTTEQTSLTWIVIGLLAVCMVVGIGLFIWKGKKTG